MTQGKKPRFSVSYYKEITKAKATAFDNKIPLEYGIITRFLGTIFRDDSLDYWSFKRLE